MLSNLLSHWAHGTWAPGEHRLHWYLLPSELSAETVGAVKTQFAVPGFDVVPEPWLHCTVVSLFPCLNESDPDAIETMIAEVRGASNRLSKIGDAKAAVTTMGSAITWEFERTASFQTIFSVVADASREMLRTDPAKPFRPHITIAYSSAEHRADDIAELVADPTCALQHCRFDTLWLLDVYQQDRCYQWDVVASVPLDGTS